MGRTDIYAREFYLRSDSMTPMTLERHIQEAQYELLTERCGVDGAPADKDGNCTKCYNECYLPSGDEAREIVAKHLTSLFHSLKEQTVVDYKKAEISSHPMIPIDSRWTWNDARQESLKLWKELE